MMRQHSSDRYRHRPYKRGKDRWPRSPESTPQDQRRESSQESLSKEQQSQSNNNKQTGNGARRSDDTYQYSERSCAPEKILATTKPQGASTHVESPVPKSVATKLAALKTEAMTMSEAVRGSASVSASQLSSVPTFSQCKLSPNATKFSMGLPLPQPVDLSPFVQTYTSAGFDCTPASSSVSVHAPAPMNDSISSSVVLSSSASSSASTSNGRKGNSRGKRSETKRNENESNNVNNNDNKENAEEAQRTAMEPAIMPGQGPGVTAAGSAPQNTRWDKELWASFLKDIQAMAATDMTANGVKAKTIEFIRTLAAMAASESDATALLRLCAVLLGSVEAIEKAESRERKAVEDAYLERTQMAEKQHQEKLQALRQQRDADLHAVEHKRAADISDMLAETAAMAQRVPVCACKKCKEPFFLWESYTGKDDLCLLCQLFVKQIEK